MKFSDGTKRSVTIMIAAAAVIALVAGTWAMLGQIFGWSAETESAPPTSGLAVEIPSGPVPPEVEAWFAEELAEFDAPFPAGATLPTVSDLLPQVKGSRLVSEDNRSLTLEYPARYVDIEEPEDDVVFAMYRRGDISVLEALAWRCDWAEAFVSAKEGGDKAKQAEARSYLEDFPDLEVVKGLPVAKQNEAELEPVLDGDLASAKEWLSAKCGR